LHEPDRVRDELAAMFPNRVNLAGLSIAVLLPCYNEALAIGSLVRAFRRALPSSAIYVYDNNSTDGTLEEAAKAGAVVRIEPYQGKGNVVRRMLADIDADVYVLADGDGTYDPAAAERLIGTLVTGNLDMVVGARAGGGEAAYRRGHRAGNRFFNRVVAGLFGPGFSDILSGYRVLSRRFAKSFPVTSSGFEIETELSVHALDLRIATCEIEVPYGERPEGSFSKLRTVRDGLRILMTILMLMKELQPLRFFGGIAAVLAILAVGISLPLLDTYLATGLVPRLPTAILAAATVQLAFLSLAVGLVLDSLARARREAKRMRFLDLRAVAGGAEPHPAPRAAAEPIAPPRRSAS
jgi:glycosyltransferase involved in cell wall biosynthesis